MSNPKSDAIAAHVRAQIRAGKYVEIAVPESRGANKWVPVDEQHADERRREQTLKSVSPVSLYVTSVLNPATGLLGAVAVDPSQTGLLELESTPLKDAPAIEVARRFSSSLNDMRTTDERVVNSLNSSTVSNYEELERIAGSCSELKASLKRIHRFQGSKTDIQTIDSLVTMDPKKLLVRSVPSVDNAVVQARYLGIQGKPGKGFIVAMQFTINTGTHGFRPNQYSQWVQLDTSNNMRTLKLLQASQLMELSISVSMERRYDLTSTKWIFSISALQDEPELVSSMGDIGRYISDNY
jgi:hypothetical protein